jgi:hypothetical protein
MKSENARNLYCVGSLWEGASGQTPNNYFDSGFDFNCFPLRTPVHNRYQSQDQQDQSRDLYHPALVLLKGGSVTFLLLRIDNKLLELSGEDRVPGIIKGESWVELDCGV